MKSYKPLIDAFSKLDKSTAEWHKTARFPKSAETVNSILYRNAIVDASTLAYFAYCLGFSGKQVIDLLDNYAKEVPKKAVEVAALKKMIAPVDFNQDERAIIEKIRQLDEAKQRIVKDMVGAL